MPSEGCEVGRESTGKKVVFHRDRLVAALNKYWRPVTVDEYLHRMDLPATENAVTVSAMPKEVVDWIWEPATKKGLVWKS